MNNRVAHKKPSDFSLGLMYEFAAEFGRQGGSPDLLQALIENKSRMVRAVAVARGDETPKGYALATLILDKDFISPKEVCDVYGFNYSSAQVSALANSLPNEKTLQWLRSNNYILVPTPPSDCNLFELRALDNQLFSATSENWYAESKYEFARQDVVEAGQWLMVRKEPYPNSQSKNWDEQKDLLTKFEHVPNVPEVSYAVTAYYKVRSVYLLKDVCVRTRSVDATDNSVIVGDFEDDGLSIEDCFDNSRIDYIGVSSALSLA